MTIGSPYQSIEFVRAAFVAVTFSFSRSSEYSWFISKGHPHSPIVFATVLAHAKTVLRCILLNAPITSIQMVPPHKYSLLNTNGVFQLWILLCDMYWNYITKISIVFSVPIVIFARYCACRINEFLSSKSKFKLAAVVSASFEKLELNVHYPDICQDRCLAISRAQIWSHDWVAQPWLLLRGTF